MSTPTLSEPYTKTVDYASLIRQELFDVILRLKTTFHAHHGVQPERVEIGYMRNSHQGYPIFRTADMVAGLPVKIQGVNDVVVSGGVEHEEEYWEADFDKDGKEDGGQHKVRYWRTHETESDL